MIAWQRHLNISPVDPHILSHIAAYTKQSASLAGCIVRLKHFSLLLVSIYLYDSEGLSARNLAILSQLYYLVLALNIPFICMGDFNMTPEDLHVSGFVSLLRAQLGDTTLDSTLYTSTKSNYDFCMYSTSISHLFVACLPILDAPWSPHISFSVHLESSPRSVQGLVHCIPKALPMEDFNWYRFYMNQCEQCQAWKE